MFYVGFLEELIFRVYIQDTFISFFNKNKWIGVVIASFIFGLWHLINASLVQVLFTFMIGLVFGLSKYLIKDTIPFCCPTISAIKHKDIAIDWRRPDILNTKNWKQR